MSGRVTRLRGELRDFFFTGFSAESLGLLRICIGLGLLLYHPFQFESFKNFSLGGAHAYYVEPIWYFQALGIDHNIPEITLVMFVVVMLATLGFALGFFTRTSIVLLLLSIFYLKGVRDSMSGDVHHRYLVIFHVLLLFLLSRCGQVYSLDSWRRGFRQRIEAWEASWPIKTMQVYICFFYFAGAVAKLRVSGMDWIDGGERIQKLLLLRAARFGIEDGVPAGSTIAFEMAQIPALCLALAMSTFVFEFGMPILLVVKNVWLRLLALSGVAFFHISNYVLASVKFLLLPIVFLVFFDLKPIFDRIRSRVGFPPAATDGPPPLAVG